MRDVDLRADCARCAALCCVAFHFDRSDQFGFDKAAGTPCAHLAVGALGALGGLGAMGTPDAAGVDGRAAAVGCRIHARRAQAGFAGCVGYDCHGAGPWVTQALFGGRSWRRDRALLAPMAVAFLEVERAHRLLALLDAAGRLDLSPADRRRLRRLAAAVRRIAARAGAVAALEAEARAFLRGLRGYVTGRAGG